MKLLLLTIPVTASVVVGGVAINAHDIVGEATQVQQAANIRQLATALELYYLDNNEYPNSLSAIQNKHYLASVLPTPELYTYTSKGTSYELCPDTNNKTHCISM